MICSAEPIVRLAHRVQRQIARTIEPTLLQMQALCRVMLSFVELCCVMVMVVVVMEMVVVVEMVLVVVVMVVVVVVIVIEVMIVMVVVMVVIEFCCCFVCCVFQSVRPDSDANSQRSRCT